MTLAIAGEDIPAGSPVVLAVIGGKVWIAGKKHGPAGEYVGHAVESIREGLRVAISENGEIREDDA